jgi:hypothetical protein
LQFLLFGDSAAAGSRDEWVTHSSSRVTLEVEEDSFHHQRMSKVEEMEGELRKLSQAELRQIREWLDGIIEDELQFTSEFERAVEQAEREMADGKSARVREPEHD